MKASARACLNCQKRKSRCVRSPDGNERCRYCIRTGKTCSFEKPPSRTPLTRNNLDDAESQCARLRDLLRSMNPGINIDLELNRMTPHPHAPKDQSQEPVDESEGSPQVPEWREGPLSPDSNRLHAGQSTDTDGMAILTTSSSGYLGSSSGSQILDQIRSAVPDISKDGNDSTSKHPVERLPPLESLGLPPAYGTSQLIDSYFLIYNTSYPIVHEQSFRDKVASNQHLKPAQASWRVLYYMVLAIGHWVSMPESHQTRATYYETAKANLSMQMLESGTYETVQAFLLIGNYLQKRNRTNTGYNYIGLACRMAFGLGLHREPSGVEDTVGLERRRQLFWIIYCFEIGFDITTGRPPTISNAFIDARLPRNIEDQNLSMNALIPAESLEPTVYSANIAQSQLYRIGEGIYNHFLQAKTAGSKVDYGLAESMERQLTSWRQNLPDYFTAADVPSWFQVPRAIVLWKEMNLRILLWRGSHNNHSFFQTMTTAMDKCLDTSMQSIYDVATFCRSYRGPDNQSMTWYATYYVFQAALVVEATRLYNGDKHALPSIERPDWQYEHSTSEARSCLKRLSEMSDSASRCLKILERIHEHRSSEVARSHQNAVSATATGSQPLTTNGTSDNVQQTAQHNMTQFNNTWLDGETNFFPFMDVDTTNSIFSMEDTSSDFLESMPPDLLLSTVADQLPLFNFSGQ